MTDTTTDQAPDLVTEVLDDIQLLANRARRCIDALVLSVREDGPIKGMNWHGHHAIWGEEVLTWTQRLRDDRALHPTAWRNLRAWRESIELTMRDTLSSVLSPLEAATWAARHKAKVDLLRITDALRKVEA